MQKHQKSMVAKTKFACYYRINYAYWRSCEVKEKFPWGGVCFCVLSDLFSLF